jgi:hypothetical protein
MKTVLKKANKIKSGIHAPAYTLCLAALSPGAALWERKIRKRRRRGRRGRRRRRSSSFRNDYGNASVMYPVPLLTTSIPSLVMRTSVYPA